MLLGGADARALPAFPGAEGAGANATGGRGGDVYRVTSLADTNTPGTLRYGVNNAPAGGRTIVFDVGGVITLSNALSVNKSKVTIAGQTAPGPGVTFRGRSIYVSGSDVVVRHVRSRVGRQDPLTNAAEDAISVTGGSNVIIDHSSAAWANDENMSISNTANNVTLQYNYVTEALNWDNHSYGTLIRPEASGSYSLHHNLWAHNRSRNPRPGSYNGATVDLDFRNNVIYNWGDQAGYSADNAPGEFVNLNYVGNYLVAGPDTTGTSAYNSAANNTIYQGGNKIDLDKDRVHDGADTGWAMFRNVDAAHRRVTPFDFAPVATDSADVAYEKVLASAGAFPWSRDAVDARVTNDVYTENTTDTVPANAAVKIILDESNVGGYAAPAAVTRPVGWDTDNDGMPDWWEGARGLNGAAADHNATTLTGPGTYTNLEHYLNYLTLVAHWGGDAGGNWDTIRNWRGTLPDATDATAIFGPTITAPRTVTVTGTRVIGQLGFNSPHGYTLAGTGNVTLDVIAGRAAIDVAAGTHRIESALTLADPTTVSVSTGAALVVANLQPFAAGITKGGGGSLTVNRVRGGSLAVNEGTVKVSENGTAAGVSHVTGVSVAAGAKLDLSDNDLLIDYTGPSAHAAVRELVRRGLSSGGASGLVVNPGPANDHVLALLDTAATGLATWEGVPVDDSTVIGKYTYFGDGTLDGKVTGEDYGPIDANLGQTTGQWTRGDYNMDGKVSGEDYGYVDANLGKGTSDPAAYAELKAERVALNTARFGESYLAVFRGLEAGQTGVPEPSTLLVVAPALLLKRRRASRPH